MLCHVFSHRGPVKNGASNLGSMGRGGALFESGFTVLKIILIRREVHYNGLKI